MDQLKEEVVQAVLIADNFNDNFQPITQTMSAVSQSIELAYLVTDLHYSALIEPDATRQHTID